MIIVWILSFQYIFQAFDIKLLNCRCHTFTPEGPGKPGFPCGPGGPWKQRRTWLRNTQSKGDHWGHWTGLHFNSEVGVGYYFMLGTCRCIHTLFPFHCLFVLWDRSAVPRGPCLCIRTLWDVLCLLPVCLPVQVTTYGCDFPHPYTFPLVSGVPQREGHSAIAPPVPKVFSKWTLSSKSVCIGRCTEAENDGTKWVFFWLKQLNIQVACKEGLFGKNKATTSWGIHVRSLHFNCTFVCTV